MSQKVGSCFLWRAAAEHSRVLCGEQLGAIQPAWGSDSDSEVDYATCMSGLPRKNGLRFPSPPTWLGLPSLAYEKSCKNLFGVHAQVSLILY